MQGVKIIGGHAYFHICAFVAMIWLKAEYGDDEVIRNIHSESEVTSAVQLLHEDPEISMLDIEGQGTFGVTEVCSDVEMGTRIVKATFTTLMWTHLANFILF
jgi:hypothetical protein